MQHLSHTWHWHRSRKQDLSFEKFIHREDPIECVCALSSTRNRELRCQETTRHRSVALTMSICFFRLRFIIYGSVWQRTSLRWLTHAFVSCGPPHTAPNSFNSKFMPSKHFIRIKSDSLEFHSALFFIFFAVVVVSNNFLFLFLKTEKLRRRSLFLGKQLQTGGLLELLKRLLMRKTHVP